MSGNAPKFDHPCFTNAPARAARMHLSVAPKCNIKCSFCNPAGGDKCVHGCMPGLTDRVLSPREALEHVRRVRDGGIDIRIVGIARPGEPLFNEETFETIALVREAFPSMHICLSTNGLLLPERLSRVLSLGVETLTVTVNCLTVDCARRVYDHVEGRRDDASFESVGGRASGRGSRAVRQGQQRAASRRKRRGDTARGTPRGRSGRVHPQCAAPHPPAGRPAPRRPSQELVDSVRAQCAACLAQFTRCRHCRADAIIDAEE